METPKLITKVTQLIEREDGSQARIVATAMFGEGLHPSTDLYVLRRESAKHQWQLCNNRPHPEFKAMSREDYLKFGRSELLRTVSIGELLKVTSMIGTPLTDHQ